MQQVAWWPTIPALQGTARTLLALPMPPRKKPGAANTVPGFGQGTAVPCKLLLPERSTVTGKPNLTTTTAIRLLLNQAADVDEALELLNQYDMHASMGMMVHFALADASGRSVAVEYVDNQMIVIETPVLTNFYQVFEIQKTDGKPG